MERILLNHGFKGMVFKIPIGVEFEWFNTKTRDSQTMARTHLGIPQSAFVIGSFQKDGNGWNEGYCPKLIKGPDLFLKTLDILRHRISDLFVLLTGPARGYVRKGLEAMNVPYKHSFVKYPDIPKYYQALDLYIVASREEGGPKAVLEAMASGVPLVSTRVGQVIDLVEHGVNGWVTSTEDYEGLADWAAYVADNRNTIEQVLQNATQTAQENSHRNLDKVWGHYLNGFL